MLSSREPSTTAQGDDDESHKEQQWAGRNAEE
jgi:hypothetical protein